MPFVFIGLLTLAAGIGVGYVYPNVVNDVRSKVNKLLTKKK